MEPNENLTQAPGPEEIPVFPDLVPETAPAGETPAKKAFTRLGYALTVLAAVAIGAQLLVVVIAGVVSAFGPAIDMSGDGWFLWAASFIPIYCIAIPCCLLMLRRVPKAPAEPTRMGFGTLLLFMLMSLPLMYGGNIIGTLLSQLLSGGAAENALNAYILNSNPLKLLVVVLLGPFLEEYVFRKQLIDRCVQYGEKTAILFSALAFGMFHMNLFQFFYAFALGLMFAYVYVRTRRVRYSYFLHVIINFLGSVIAPAVVNLMQQTGVTSGTLTISSTSMVPKLLLIAAYELLILGGSVAGLVLLIVKLTKLVFLPAPEELPKGTRFKTVYRNAGFILFAAITIVMCVISLL